MHRAPEWLTEVNLGDGAIAQGSAGASRTIVVTASDPVHLTGNQRPASTATPESRLVGIGEQVASVAPSGDMEESVDRWAGCQDSIAGAGRRDGGTAVRVRHRNGDLLQCVPRPIRSDAVSIGGGVMMAEEFDGVEDVEAMRDHVLAVLGEFRRSLLLVPIRDGGILAGNQGGLRWIFAFTDTDTLTAWSARAECRIEAARWCSSAALSTARMATSPPLAIASTEPAGSPRPCRPHHPDQWAGLD